jgi:hypothetical protein
MSKSKNTSSEISKLDELEAHLAGTLKPVSPRKDFVRHLRGRIHIPPREEIVFRLRDWERLFLVFGGVISGTLVILTVARALFHLFGRRNIG